MAVLDRLSEIAEKQARTAGNRKDDKKDGDKSGEGSGKKTGNTGHEAPVLVKKSRARDKRTKDAENRKKPLEAQIGRRGVAVRREPRGLFGRLFNSLRENARKGDERRKAREAKTRMPGSVAAAGAGMDNFMAGRTERDPGARNIARESENKPLQHAPTVRGREITEESRDERQNRFLDTMSLNLFDRLDANGDGVLSWEELQPLRNVVSLEELDINHDGVVNWREFRANFRQIDSGMRETVREKAREQEEESRGSEKLRDERDRPVRRRGERDGPVL